MGMPPAKSGIPVPCERRTISSKETGKASAQDSHETRSFDAALRCAASCMPDELIGSQALERLALCGATLPACAAHSMFGFEMRLDDPLPLCDFFMNVPPDSPIAAWPVKHGQSNEACATDRSLGRLLHELQRRDSFLSRWFDRVLLEWDIIDSNDSDQFLPGLFLTPAVDEREDLPDHVPPYQIANSGVIVAVACAAANWQEDKEEFRTAFRIVDELPAGARITHIGVLPARKFRAIRFLFPMPPGEVADYLGRIGWEGPCDTVTDVLLLASLGFERLTVALDVTGSSISPRIGFELHFARPWRTLVYDIEHDFIDLCVAEGWCVPSKAKGLKKMARWEYFIHEGEFVPFLSGLNHFKLVVQDQKVLVKAYTGAQFLF